jgi:hypothetical protein
MAAHEFEPARAGRDPPTFAPRNNLVLARMSEPAKTRVGSLLVFSGSMLVVAAVLAAAGYWGFRHLQRPSLFAPASASSEQGRSVELVPVVALPLIPG